MDIFFISAGDFLYHEIIERNTISGHRIFTSIFHYKYGTASFDGREWIFTL